MLCAARHLLSRLAALALVMTVFAAGAASADASPPSAPQNVAATPATSQAQVSWTAPASNGGSQITSYTITPYIGSAAQTPTQVNNGSATSSTVTGLTNGTAYTFTVMATNVTGTGPESAPSGAVTPADTIFDFSGTPQKVDSGDPGSNELGVKFTADTSGSITGIRFYKSAANTGTHIGNLWTAGGNLLASATFTNETASGWQTVAFSSPVAISAGTTYVASYFDPAGHYSATSFGLSTAVDNPPLHSVSDSSSSDGVYAYTTTSMFPTNTYQSNNYWVDVLFAPTPVTPPGQPTNVAATAGNASATVSWTAPSTGGAPSGYAVTPYIGSTAQTPTNVSGTTTSTTINGLTQGTSYTFTVQASNSAGSGPVSTPSNAVTPTGASSPSPPRNVTAGPATSQALVGWTAPASNGGSPVTGYTITPYIGSAAQTTTQVASGSATSAIVTGLTNGTAYTFTVKATNAIGTGPESSPSAATTPQDTIFDFSGTPQKIDGGDPGSNELGVKFTADTSGSITGIRFYKSAANTGTHIGNLWTANGTLLASATFTNETPSGWQTVTFASPVAITAGTTYVASYFDPSGHYSATSFGLNTAVDNAPLHTVANGSSANGVYAYTTTSTFPTNSYQANNYWVDVLFSTAPQPPPGQPTGVSATAGFQSATVSWTAPSTGGTPTTYTVTPYIGSTAQTPTTAPGTATSTTVSGLTQGTSYTFTVQASNSSGAGPVSAASNAVTPTGASAPAAPQNVTAAPASSQASVSWSAPGSNGGSPITGYTITPYVGSTAQTPTQVNNGSTTSAVVTGLTNETAYTFTVKATNAIGTGPESTPSASTTPADTIFDFSGIPAKIDAGDPGSNELGVKFTADSSGWITGIRFYKSAANTGTHLGDLWTADGNLLASATFANETATGWQTVLFSSPVAITAGTTYVASYFDPNGHYSATSLGLNAAVDNPPLHAVANSTSVNGVYAYTTTSTFPTNSYQANNYWVDVLFVPPSGGGGAPGTPTNVNATALPQGASVTWTPSFSGGSPTSYMVTPYIGSDPQNPTTVPGTATSATMNGLIPGIDYTFTVTASNANGSSPESSPSNSITPTPASAPSTPQNVKASPASGEAMVSWTAPNANGSAISGYTITPYVGSSAQAAVQVNGASTTTALVTGLTNGTSYTFTVKAINGVGTSPESSPSAAAAPEDTIFDFLGTPAKVDAGDPGSNELGVKFTANTSGSVTGIRFYKSAANTGTHIGNLWSAGGALLASATFTNETASGWQSVAFANPVAITAGTTYVASYFDPHGHYAATTNGLSSAIDNLPLHTVANSTSANGVYAYTPTSAFPTNTFQANNYWVDVLFAPSSANSPPDQPANVTATPGYATATITWTAPWNGGSPITSYTITPYIGSTAQTTTTVSGSPPALSATISGLTNGTSYTFTVTATNANGTGQASTASTAVAPGPQPQGLWSGLQNWPLVAIHTALLHTGNLLVWDGWQQPAPTQEFNPATQAFTNPGNSPDALFCSAMAQLPDGRILVIGGYGELSTGNLGIVDTNIYDPATSTWTRVADMHNPRWYPGLTELADGRYVAISGKSVDYGTWADTPEVYDPTANTWTQLSGVSTSQIHELEYPNTYLLPNGNVFVLGPQEDQSFELNVGAQTWNQVGGSSGVVNGGSVMYRPGKILYAGGAASLASPSDAQANAAVIDLTGSNPQWQSIASMHFARAFNTLQMLADGTVLGVGGEPVTGQANGQGEVAGGVLPAEIWDPSTQQWTTVASMSATRGYHTTTMLMPDGRVLVAGSGHASPGVAGQYSAQYYSPPYLFEGPRPTITSAPSSATYGSNITVSTPDASSIQSVNLVDLGTSTHQMDFSQHFVPLSFTAGSGSLNVQMPSSGNFAPPAYYMLFIVNSSGVPSVAKIMNVGAAGGGNQSMVKAASGSATLSTAPDLPAAPQSVNATVTGASTAHVTWSEPKSPLAGPVKSYTVTPYQGGRALTPVTVTGSPAPTRTTVTRLTAGGHYRFKVRATNHAGTGPPSAPSKAVTTTSKGSPEKATKTAGKAPPAFVQQTSSYADTTGSLELRPRSAITAGDRLVVETSIWGHHARAEYVTDSAGNHYTQVLRRVARDGTEMTVWTAPITAGGGMVPTITVTPSAAADVGAVAVEYSGLSRASGLAAVDRVVGTRGATRGAAVVGPPATRPRSGTAELAVGLYADSGFGDKLSVGRGFRGRVNISPTTTSMEQLVEDRLVRSTAPVSATVRTGSKTPWLMGLVLFKVASGSGSAREAASSPAGPGTTPPTTAVSTAHELTAAPVLPLSQRARPHPVAGDITGATKVNSKGQVIHYYCLVDPTGKKDLSKRTVGSSAFSWMPPVPAFA